MTRTRGEVEQLDSELTRLTREIDRMKADIVREKFNIRNTEQLMAGHKADLNENIARS